MRLYRASLATAYLLASSNVLADAMKESLADEWATQGYSARVRVAPCTDKATVLCGEVVWLWNPLDEDGEPLRDLHNPRPELRLRSLIGLRILNDVRLDTTSTVARWVGSIYDPESGRTYRASLTRPSEDILELEGCVLFVCRSQTWRRTTSLCPAAALSPITSSTSPKETS